MHPHVFPALAFAALTLCPSLYALQDAVAPNADSILRELEAIEQKQKQSKSAAKNTILTQLQSAAASGSAAASFYTDAVEQVQFQGQKGKVEAFTDWKKKNSDLLRSKPMQTALLLYMRYAALAVQRKGIEKPATLAPASLSYINELVAADDSFQESFPDEAKNLLNKPLGQSVIAQWIELGEWLPADNAFELTPGNITGIFDKNIRPFLREAKDPQLIATWDLQMKIEADRITTGRSEHKAEQFNTVTRPKLLFLRAKDMKEIGQPNRALAEMLALVRQNPEHPDFPSWVKEIRDSVKVVAPAPAPAAAEAPTTPTGTSPQ